MKKSLILLLSLGLMAFAVTGCGGNDDQGQTDDQQQQQTEAASYTWGSASLGSNGYVIIEAFVSTINKTDIDFVNASVSTGGGAENMALLGRNEIQFGQAMSSDMSNAKHGIAPYDGVIEFNQILGYQWSELPIVVFEDSDIQTPDQLAGKRVAVGPASGAAAFVSNILFTELGLIDDVEFVYGSWSECADLLKVGQADAVVNFHINGALVTSVFAELYETKPMRPISVDTAILEKMAAENDGLVVSSTKAGAYPAYKEAHPCIGLTAVLVCQPGIPEDHVYTVTKTIMENMEGLIEMAPVQLTGFSQEMALDTLVKGYPIHPGAAKYYKEAGLWRDDMVMAE